jgi:hypothetical protein
VRTSFQERYPDFAGIEYQIRQAHAERSLYIATLLANGIVKVARGIGGLFATAPAKAPVSQQHARV